MPDDSSPLIDSMDPNHDDAAMFPTLTPSQISRFAAIGIIRKVTPLEVLVEAGERTSRFFVVISGIIQIVQAADGTEKIVATFQPGVFPGAATMLSGRRGLAQIRAAEAGEVIEIERERLLTLVQADSELSDILIRAFILRRIQLVAQGVSDVVLVGSTNCAGTLRIKEFLTRNGHPYSFVDLDRDTHVQDLLDRFRVDLKDVPVVICRGRTVLRNPSNEAIADCLGFNEAIDQSHLRDLIIVGAGPSGLAAAV